jgi:hypothetical protein
MILSREATRRRPQARCRRLTFFYGDSKSCLRRYPTSLRTGIKNAGRNWRSCTLANRFFGNDPSARFFGSFILIDPKPRTTLDYLATSSARSTRRTITGRVRARIGLIKGTREAGRKTNYSDCQRPSIGYHPETRRRMAAR